MGINRSPAGGRLISEAEEDIRILRRRVKTDGHTEEAGRKKAQILFSPSPNLYELLLLCEGQQILQI